MSLGLVEESRVIWSIINKSDRKGIVKPSKTIELIYKFMANHIYGFYYVYTIQTLVYTILRHILFDSVYNNSKEL